MTLDDLNAYILVAGGKRPFARRVDISERYVDMLLTRKRTMSKELAEIIRLKIVMPQKAIDRTAR